MRKHAIPKPSTVRCAQHQHRREQHRRQAVSQRNARHSQRRVARHGPRQRASPAESNSPQTSAQATGTKAPSRSAPLRVPAAESASCLIPEQARPIAKSAPIRPGASAMQKREVVDYLVIQNTRSPSRTRRNSAAAARTTQTAAIVPAYLARRWRCTSSRPQQIKLLFNRQRPERDPGSAAAGGKNHVTIGITQPVFCRHRSNGHSIASHWMCSGTDQQPAYSSMHYVVQRNDPAGHPASQ